MHFEVCPNLDYGICVLPSFFFLPSSHRVVFEDGTAEAFDGVVLATGYEMFSGHRHFLDESSLDAVGTGKEVSLFLSLYFSVCFR